MKKLLSLILCASMTVSLIACGSGQSDAVQGKNENGAANASADTAENEEAVLEKALSSQIRASHSSQTGKEETVYVMADAKGSVNKIIVENWIKNGTGSSTLEDKSELKDIENVKGYETFTQGSDGSLVWNADGADIYYQGTTEMEPPVDVKISYKLDGKEISPEEIAGKSGRVTIRFDYENKQTRQMQIGGRTEEIYVPFAMISGMILPSDKFSDIEAVNAKLISEGDNNLIVGVAFPGLKESLKLEELKEEVEEKEKREDIEEIEIPEYIEVSADAQDFSLDMTMTMAMSDVLSDIALTDSIDLSDMNASMDELSDASHQLTDGSAELKDGTAELKNGTAELSGGAAELKDGAAQLRSGTETLAGGAGELNNGASQLKAGTQELYTKSGELQAGAGELDEGAATLSAGSKQLAEGTKQLASGSVALNTGAAQLSAGLTDVQTALAAMLGGMEGSGTAAAPGLVFGMQTLTDGIKGLNGLLNQYFTVYEKTISDKLAMLQGMKAQADSQAAAANAALAQAQAAQNEAKAVLAEACEPVNQTIQIAPMSENGAVKAVTVSGNVPSEGTDAAAMTEVSVSSVSAEEVKNAVDNYQKAAENVAAYQAAADAAAAQSQTLQEIIGELTKLYMGTGVFGDSAEAAQAAYITYIKEAVANLAQGAENVNNGIGSLYQGMLALNDAQKGVPALAAGAGQLKQGTEEAVAGMQKLSAGAEELDAGTGALKSGLGTLHAGTGLLTEGVKTLKDGAGALAEGTEQLNSGAKELDDGAARLDEGITELKEGVIELDNGASMLDDGALRLNDGMIQFQEEGISKLTELFGDNVRTVLDRIEAVEKAGSEYNTFAGLKEGTAGSVRFIYKTDAVKAE